MPVIIPEKLPASDELKKLGVFVMNEYRAKSQDIRPLKVCIVNLMPDKISTEKDILTMLSNNMIQVDITLLAMKSHISKNTAQTHLDDFYCYLDEIQDKHFDALIVTGAPVEMMEFEDVDYWNELTQILDWSKTNVYSSLFICWGGQSALYHFYGIKKEIFPKKLFGVFPTKQEQTDDQLFVGMDKTFNVPQSRYTASVESQIRNHPDLQVLASSEDAGIHLVASKDRRQLFMAGHPEYSEETLENEYLRDVGKEGVELPKNYFKNDDPNDDILVRWKSDASIFYNNWLNYYIYQETDYDLDSK